MARDWDEFDRFEGTIQTYMPPRGEGDTMASQAVTAVNKLVYQWYNYGDVFDNSYYLDGWCNDLSSYANWLYWHVPATRTTLMTIKDCVCNGEYEELLYELAGIVLDDGLLHELERKEADGSIYDCDGYFKFREDGAYDDDDDYDYDEEDEDDD